MYGTVRPSLVVLDDPQTDESARSLSQCATRESILAGAVLGLAQPEGLEQDLEALPVLNREFQHRRIIPMFGMPIGEFWDFESLADDCAKDGQYEVFLVAKPLNLPQGVGSPPNAYAIK